MKPVDGMIEDLFTRRYSQIGSYSNDNIGMYKSYCDSIMFNDSLITLLKLADLQKRNEKH